MAEAKDSVLEFLKKNGFPFEMSVAKAFRQAGFPTYQGMMYKDPRTEENRELDIIAWHIRPYGGVSVSFKFIIECKYAENPWILFNAKNEGFEELPMSAFFCANYAGTKLLEQLSISNSYQYLDWFCVDKKMCYGLTNMNKDSKKNNGNNIDSYKAIMTLINALYTERSSKPGNIFSNNTFDIYIPIIAIRGKLFESYLNDENEIEVNEIDEGQLLYKSNHVFPGIFPLINIVTEDKISKLIEKLKTNCDLIIKENLESLNDIFQDYPLPPNAYTV